MNISEFIEVELAELLLRSHQASMPEQQTPIYKAHGKVLAENIFAERPFPPFDRVTMDGIALAYDSLKEAADGEGLEITARQFAGQAASDISAGGCAEVMTGAPLPLGADMVIPYEHISIEEKNGLRKAFLLTKNEVRLGQNIHSAASDHPAGHLLLSKGVRLGPPEIALAANEGYVSLLTYGTPKVAIVATGDELVDIGQKPLDYQIRQTNAFMLQSFLLENGYECACFHAKDDKTELYDTISAALENHDVLLLTGGVSVGESDFVPGILESLNVRRVFHKIKQRPGKPMWFGFYDNSKAVFALPGNPVSALACFTRYVIPWLERATGTEAKKYSVLLASDYTFKPDLTYLAPAKISLVKNALWAVLHPGHGSGDFVNLLKCDGFLELPIGKDLFRAGSLLRFYPFRKIF